MTSGNCGVCSVVHCGGGVGLFWLPQVLNQGLFNTLVTGLVVVVLAYFGASGMNGGCVVLASSATCGI